MADISEEFNRLENNGVEPRFIIPAICYTILMVIGTFGNLCIIFAVKRKKSLHNLSNYLLASNAAGDIGHQLSHICICYYVFSGKNVTSLINCFYLMMFSLFCMTFTLCIMTWIALDRILMIVLGPRYQHFNKNIYLIFVILSSCFYGIILLAFGYFEMTKDPQRKVICNVVTIFIGKSQKIWMFSQFSAVAICILSYLTFWGLLKIGNKFKLNDITTRLVLRTVTTVVAIVLLCWEITTAAMIIAEALNASGTQLTTVIMYGGILINISTSANYFVYFALSSEYREAFNDQLKFLTCGLYKKGSKQPHTSYYSRTSEAFNRRHTIHLT